ncbi:hypothetical protein [Pseudomonas nitroreducens]|uniref:hypothetical protein n=1 Tax=Pseudomonas nitroreducens TaxID=46680 RepID=UPI00265945A6|nr:hypothetical protein [Pseudomonas nitroreducens]MCP1652315.1 hypothetical protein [Pseudomonas nitroreducens]MCP1689825.1 hypothetical protein [Pseudomonas nitroreducens]
MSNTSILNDADWPHDRDVVVLVKPSARKRVGFTLLGIAILIFGGMAVLGERGPVASWLQSIDRETDRAKLEPEMRKMAEQGKPEAIIWLAQNFQNESRADLEALANQGNGTALFTLGALRLQDGDEGEFKSLMKQAAEAGNADALRLVKRQAER